MNYEAIIHTSDKPDIYPVSKYILCFRLKAARCDIVSCRLICWNREKGPRISKKEINMQCIQRDNRFDYFQAKAEFDSVACFIHYYFELSDGAETVWLNSWGISHKQPEKGFFDFMHANEKDCFTMPDWAKSQIYYQIFPERFCNGDTANDPEGVQIWGSTPDRIHFMGGDLKGIISKIEYIVRLGVTCLYLTPIFKSPSNHKYDTADYYRIDPGFGTIEDLRELVELCHKNEIRVILDGVFNHCGYEFMPFQDVLKNGENSSYLDWFYFNSLPPKTDSPNYDCFGDYKLMPRLRLSNPQVKDFILKVAEYWIRECNIDGWRLDVADAIEGTFWEQFRNTLSEKFHDKIFIAETWGIGSKMLRGDQMDSCMNYLFRDAVLDFFAKNSISAVEFDSRINTLLATYTEPVNQVMYNLLDSHDTPRFLTECGNNPEILKVASGFQFAFVGSPAVYYGDEIGLSGENDPYCRKAMIWDERQQNRELLNWYTKLIKIRKAHNALISGSFLTNICHDDKAVYGFIRTNSVETIYVAVNVSERTEKITIPIVDFGCGNVYDELISGGIYTACQNDDEQYNSFYNSDILNYNGIIKADLPQYSIKMFVKQK